MRSNKTFDELAVGEEASITRVVSRDDLFVFAHASGSLDPPPLNWSTLRYVFGHEEEDRNAEKAPQA